MQDLKTRLKKSGTLLFLSAVLAALPLTFPSLFLLSWVAYVPFFFVILNRSGNGSFWRAIGRGAWFGFVLHSAVYYWFFWLYPLDFTGLNSTQSLFVVFFAWLGISFCHGVLYAIPTLVCHAFAKKNSNRPFLLFSASVGILVAQKITALGQVAFPWIRVSLGQYRAPALIQSASLWGMDGVDLLILSVSALLTLNLVSQNQKRIFSLGVAAALFLSNLTFGWIRLGQKPTKETICAQAIQGCLLSGEKWHGTGALATYRALTLESSDEAVDLVVWPETAVPIALKGNESLQEEYRLLSEEAGAPILMGCFWEKDGKTTNSAVLIDSDSVSDAYSKRHLVPFGEYVPYRDFIERVFPSLTQINMLSSDLAPGESAAPLSDEAGKYGVLVCFESIFPDLCRESIKEGAELLVVVTNDSWYKDSPAVWQHLAHSVFRSVENGRAVVRSANSGVSALIDHRGRILELLGPLEQGTVTGEVGLSCEKTLYTSLGDVVFPASLFCVVLWGTVLILKERRTILGGSKGSDHR